MEVIVEIVCNIRIFVFLLYLTLSEITICNEYLIHLGHLGMNGPGDKYMMGSEHSGEQTYATLIFTLLDKARPKPEGSEDRAENRSG